MARGRTYDLQLRSSPLEHLEQYKCVLIVIDHSSYAYARIVDEAQLVVNTLSNESTTGSQDCTPLRYVLD